MRPGSGPIDSTRGHPSLRFKIFSRRLGFPSLQLMLAQALTLLVIICPRVDVTQIESCGETPSCGSRILGRSSTRPPWGLPVQRWSEEQGGMLLPRAVWIDELLSRCHPCQAQSPATLRVLCVLQSPESSPTRCNYCNQLG